ncbi:MAG: molybdopterin-guanine dinucleotide biosynthesis protein B [Clostridia bacterium]|nr:molybdopterin-guanine dinucleotide biosynthesis protein B [Clostridia bacterium]
MKVLTVVGIRRSGKTTVCEQLIRALTARGFRVGTVKTVFCPVFEIDQPGTNTDRHRKAGAVMVAARAQRETVLMMQEACPPSRLLGNYSGCDWVICEGDYQLPVPRLVCAKQNQDAAERTNDLTVAVTGVISNDLPTPVALDLSGRSVPALHPERDLEALLDLLESSVQDVRDLRALDTPLNGPDVTLSMGMCHTICEKEGHHRKAPAPKDTDWPLRVSLRGQQVQLTESQEKAILAILSPSGT